MRTPLYIVSYYDSGADRLKRASHLGREVDWSARVPQLWRPQTIGPLWVDVNRDLEVGAERWVGYDEEEAPCYCRHRFQVDIGSLAGQCSKDMQANYSEDLSAWRMRDGRWLIHRTITCHAESHVSYSFYAFSESMPR